MAFDDSLEVLGYAHFDELLSLWRLGKKAHTQKVNTSSCSDIVVLIFTSHSIHFRIISFYYCLSASAKCDLLLGSVV